MAGRWGRALGMLGALSLVAVFAEAAGAQTVGEASADRSAEIPLVEARIGEQDALLEQQIGEISAVGTGLEEAQSRVNIAHARATQLGEQARTLERELDVRREAFASSKDGYEKKVRAAYKGAELEGLSFLLDTLLGSADSPARLADPRVAGILLEGRQSLEAYRESGRILRDTSRQISQKKQDYEEALRQERARTNEFRRRKAQLEESVARISSDRARMETRLHEIRAAERARILEQRAATGVGEKKQDHEEALRQERARTNEFRRRKAQLEESVARISSDRARMETRLHEIRAAERARILEQRAATGVGEASRRYELRFAREKIVAEPVEPISKRKYERLYRASARKYGFGKDWYVLAAVGKVESNHGESMGPSSTGAMGPMQFLPSTWKTVGVDGNGDGVANIMDPRDAIPAAARYLRMGGAPRHWYRALLTYNHADWYVVKVLGVAEGYRRLAHDNTVGPYI